MRVSVHHEFLSLAPWLVDRAMESSVDHLQIIYRDKSSLNDDWLEVRVSRGDFHARHVVPEEMLNVGFCGGKLSLLLMMVEYACQRIDREFSKNASLSTV